ncbi:MAG: helix-turn-helix transcriptional regulator [Oscillospiraceae bacterium]|nr:helix-turn-helix transcriptional regulator [Oscillospiraceae bacterium]
MLINLKQLRKKHGISQKQLAAEVGVSQQSINKYENHNIEPDIATLKRIADYFQTSVDHLIGHEIPDLEASAIKAPLSEELVLLQRYRSLTERQKQSIDLIISNYLEK